MKEQRMANSEWRMVRGEWRMEPTRYSSLATHLTEQVSFVGDWYGTLKTGTLDLRIVFHLKQKPDGGYEGTVDSPDQGATGIPISEVVVEGQKITLRVEAVQGEFVGTLSEDGKTLKGEWKQSGVSLPLELKLGAAPPAPRRPQEPKPPFPYHTEEVTVTNQKAKVRLAGTLTLPRGKPPFPCVVLLTGSGAQNRDEEIFGHKPFFVLADYLTRRGFATLRMDDRGVGGSTGDMRDATTFDFVGDALAAVAYLKTRREIDPKRIGLLGHSEGALVATIAAAQSRDIAFIILLAGTGVPGDQILFRQAELIARKSGVAEEAIARNRQLQMRVIEILRREPDEEKAAQQITEVLIAHLVRGNLSEAQRQSLEAQARNYTRPWYRVFIDLNPAEYLRKVKCPVLALGGANDLQVDPDQNLPAIEKALKAGG
ncbi:MAG: alpha/beta fold hydrolase, partial [Fimbriimonadales bacterium]|nr:alpha/beta fold hydrolase [Fimbriimonadales bacterium]